MKPSVFFLKQKSIIQKKKETDATMSSVSHSSNHGFDVFHRPRAPGGAVALPRNEIRAAQKPSTHVSTRDALDSHSDSNSASQTPQPTPPLARTSIHNNASLHATFADVRKSMQKERNDFITKDSPNQGLLYDYLKTQSTATSQVFNADSVRARGANGSSIVTRSNDEYHNKILPMVVSDIDNNIASTLCEYTDMKINHVRLFVRFCYGSVYQLPSDTLMQRHILMAHALALECFPNLKINGRTHEAVVRRWHPRIKYPNISSTTSPPMLRMAIAIVWPTIVLQNMDALVCFWSTLDMRLTAQCPEFANPVDFNCLRIDRARCRLQTILSHKTTNCAQCQTLNQTVGEYESSDEEHSIKPHSRNMHQEVCSACQGTARKIRESIVVPLCNVYTDMQSGESHIMTVDNQSTTSLLHSHSIIPSFDDEQNSRDLVFESPHDAPSRDDVLANNCASAKYTPFHRELLCKLDANKFQSNLDKKKTTVRLNGTEHGNIFTLCTDLIRQVGYVQPKFDDLHLEQKTEVGPYAFTVVHNVTFNQSKKTLYVDVQGRGARYCFLHGGEHDKDVRVFFCINVAYFNVTACCKHPQCFAKVKEYRDHAQSVAKAKKNPNKLINVLTLSDEEQSIIANKMTVDVPLEVRDRLTVMTLGKHYCGLLPQRVTLQPCEQMQPSYVDVANMQFNNDMDSSSDTEFDSQTGMKLPRHLLQASLLAKTEYVNQKRKRKLVHKDNLCEPKTTSFVDIPTHQPTTDPHSELLLCRELLGRLM